MPVCVHRGNLDEAGRLIDLVADLEESGDVQERGYYASAKAALLLASGDAEGALAAGERAWAGREWVGATHESAKEGLVTALDAALRAELPERAEELLATVEALRLSERSQFLDAHAARFRALLAARRGDAAEAERLFKRAGALLQELAVVFALAVVRLEHAEWLGANGRADEAEPLLVLAREAFERLEAAPWLDRCGSSLPVAGSGG